MSDVPIEGEWDPRFVGVVEAFRHNLDRGGDLGGSFAVGIGSELVVDIWGGWTDAACENPWKRDTIVNVYSVTKGITALAVHMLVDWGQLNLDQAIAYYWPEFSANQKADIPMRYALAHLAGLPSLREPLRPPDLFDWNRVCDRIASERPSYKPGTEARYHALTFGHLVGEPLRRVSGMSVGEFVGRYIAEPLAADFLIGMRSAELPRVSDVYRPVPVGADAELPRIKVGLANSLEWRNAELPSVNGHSNARGIAKIYQPLAMGGGELVSAEAVERMRRRERGAMPIPRRPKSDAAWASGFMPNWTLTLFGPNPGAFGHTGFGGSFGACDPEAGISIGFAVNQLADERWVDDRGASLVRAFYHALRA